MTGNSPGPTDGGQSSEAARTITAGDFIDELEYEHIMMHLMNNSVIQDAAMRLRSRTARQRSMSEDYRQLLADHYDNANLTLADVDQLSSDYDNPPFDLAHARLLIAERDRWAALEAQTADADQADYEATVEAATAEYEETVEGELMTVRETFQNLAVELGGDHQNAIDNRADIQEVDDAIVGLLGQYNSINSQLNELQRDAQANGIDTTLNRLRGIARGYDEWGHQSANDQIWEAVILGEHEPFVSSMPRDSAAQMVEQYRNHIERTTLSYAQDMSSQYPQVYKNYNELIGGFHLTTWSERWWAIGEAVLWIGAVEILGRVAAFALAPVTAGASVVLINVGTQIGRSRILGAAVAVAASSPRAVMALRTAGAAASRTLAVAQWILDLPDRIIMAVFTGFYNAARRVFPVPLRGVPSPASASTIPGTGITAAAANCCVRRRG